MPNLNECAHGITLPAQAVTRAGVAFCPQDDVWSLRDAVASKRFDFRAITGIAPGLIPPLKAVLTWYLQNVSLCHSAAMFQHFKLLFGGANQDGQIINRIEPCHLINHRSNLGESRAWYLASLGGAIKKWHSLGYPGVDDATVKLLNEMRRPGNLKGTAVLTMDPRRGPFTDLELQAVQAGVNKAFVSGQLDREEYLLIWLFLLLGLRPAQVAALKLSDLKAEGKGDARQYLLRVPRVKQRGQLARSEFKTRPLRADVGRLAENHIQSVRKWALEIGLEDAPIFPVMRRPKVDVPTFEWHRTTAQIGSDLTHLLNGLDVISERTGEALNFTPYRFRYTLGTRAAEEGHGELVIAELLDHSDTQNAGIYVKATPAIIERLDKQLALQMAPLAQAFTGILVGGKEDTSPNRIADFRFDPDHPVGGCGNNCFCEFAAPIACYTCLHFRPWLEGPHEAVLDHLIAERKRLMARGDLRIAAVNDRTILAVAEVVKQCQELHSRPVATEGRHG